MCRELPKPAQLDRNCLPLCVISVEFRRRKESQQDSLDRVDKKGMEIDWWMLDDWGRGWGSFPLAKY